MDKILSIKEVVTVIPALNPDQKLADIIRDLRGMGFTRYIVVNDGSNPACDPIFNEISREPGVTLLQHSVNVGKGRALKTAFNYFLAHCQGYCGVVTVDADGQHASEDISNVAEELLRTPRALVLGTRSFSGQVPFRSRMGNVVTRYIFRIMLGKAVSDTQTGLRGIPATMLADFLKLPGDRYEYETNMLISACRNRQNIVEVPITTIYVDGNSSSHFDPFRDSLRIYFVLFRFGIVSAFTAAIDYTAFIAYFAAMGSIPNAIVVGRSCAITVNFLLNRKFVFKSDGKLLSTLIAYLALVAFMAFVAFLMIQYFHDHFGISVILSKLVSETILFIFSFSIQNNFIFVSRKQADKEDQ